MFDAPRPRVPAPGTLRPPDKRKPATARGRETLRFGTETIDLAAVSQLVDAAQSQAIAYALDRLAELVEQTPPLPLDAAIQILCDRLDAEGLDVLSPHRGHPGHLARPRSHEIHAAVNRYRGLHLAGSPAPRG